MSLTVEEAAKRYVAAYGAWKQAKAAHAQSMYDNPCETEQAEIVRQKGLSPWEDRPMPKRCFGFPLVWNEWDGGYHRSTCDGCLATWEFRLAVVSAARRKGAAHAVLTRTVARNEQ